MKRVFLAAALAIVAVGGALKASATDALGVTSGNTYHCLTEGSLCSEITEQVIVNGEQGSPSTFFTNGERFEQ